MSTWKLFIDGAARNNPGPAGAGIVIYQGEKIVAQHAFFLGDKTNNQAEYYALLLGIFFIRPLVQKGERILIFSDSKLLVFQCGGLYKVKHPGLITLHRVALRFLQDLSYRMEHIMRGENGAADRCANEGIDKKIPLPESFIKEFRDLE